VQSTTSGGEANGSASTNGLDDNLLAHLDQVIAENLPTPDQEPSRPSTDLATDSVLSTSAPRADMPDVAVPEHGDDAPWWARIVADPGFAPEHIVREAIRSLGPQAHQWVERTRQRYPDASPDALARLAAEEHVRTARSQAVANTTILGSMAEVGLLARTHASLVLTIAAVYGADPTADDRIPDLLQLLPIPRLTQPSLDAAGRVARVVGAVAVRRVAARIVPFGAAVAGFIHSGRTTQDVAVRSIDRYRPKR
jgi:hypothetical protein